MRPRAWWGWAAGVWLIDQATKAWIVSTFPLYAEKIVTPFFSLTHVFNTGAAFGLFQDGNLWLAGLTVIVLAVLTLSQSAEGRVGFIGLGLIWGGALGNLTDRLARGHVVDFLDFHWAGRHWPAFNVADSAITVGVACLLLSSLKQPARTA